MKENPDLNLSPLILPLDYVKRSKRLMKWFRDIDNRLASYVEQGIMNIDHAQAYYRVKVEQDIHLSKADKQLLANESKLYKIPHPNLC